MVDLGTWQKAEIRWTAQIATQVGFTLDNAKLLQQLQKSNQKSDRVIPSNAIAFGLNVSRCF